MRSLTIIAKIDNVHIKAFIREYLIPSQTAFFFLFGARNKTLILSY